MKKVLLATTMIVAGASIAAAETAGVTLSGDARMGLINDFGNANDVGFTSRARVQFTLAGESDSGLSFGGSFRANNATGAASGTAGSVFISGAFGKLTMGDIDGAANVAVGHVDAKSLTGLGDFNESVFIGNGGLDTDDLVGTDLSALTSDPTARYEYSVGGFTGYISATLPNYSVDVDADMEAADTAADVPLGILEGDVLEGDAYAIGAKYTIDAYTVAIGYETLEFGVRGAATPLVDLDHVILGASGTFSNITVKANYGKADGTLSGDAADFRQYALSATYSMDAFGVTAYTNNRKLEVDGGIALDAQAIGLGASYDLGGGATAVAGVARVKDKVDNTSETAFDLGVSFTF